ncbi:MAG TPA: TolC family protein, partial [Longimicrobiales bacterium]
IAPPPEALHVAVDTLVAVREALANGSALRQLDLQTVQAQRRVATARLQNSFNARLSGVFGYNQTASLFSDVYQSPLQQQRFGLNVQMPLLAWGAGRDEVAAARADEKRVAVLAERTRRQIGQQAHFAGRSFEQALTQLQLAAKADTVANKRFEVAKSRYVIGKIAMGDLYIAQTEKDAAVKAYVEAVRAYWVAYYQLRKITLYDFVEGKPID